MCTVFVSLFINLIRSVSVPWTVPHQHEHLLIYPLSFHHFTAQTPTSLAVGLTVILTDILPILSLLWSVSNAS